MWRCAVVVYMVCTSGKGGRTRRAWAGRGDAWQRVNPFAYLQRVDCRVVAPDIIADLNVQSKYYKPREAGLPEQSDGLRRNTAARGHSRQCANKCT